MAGESPLSQYGNLAVVAKVMSGIRPERPTDASLLGLSDVVWQVVRTCWIQERDERPTVAAVLQCLNKATRYWDPPVAASSLKAQGTYTSVTASGEPER